VDDKSVVRAQALRYLHNFGGPVPIENCPLRPLAEAGPRRVSGGEGEVGASQGPLLGLPHLTPTLSAPRGGEGEEGPPLRSKICEYRSAQAGTQGQTDARTLRSSFPRKREPRISVADDFRHSFSEFYMLLLHALLPSSQVWVVAAAARCSLNRLDRLRRGPAAAVQ
jgi:hypothetical protein